VPIGYTLMGLLVALRLIVRWRTDAGSGPADASHS